MENIRMVSVIIPTYKQRGGLKNSIDSVLNQSYKYFEIIVVDDNNPETYERLETEKLMSAYCNDNRVIYLKHVKNKNGAAARNTGIKNSKGDFIAFLDDDDVFLPEKLEKQVEYLDSHLEYSAVYNLVEINKKVVKSEYLSGNLLKELLSEKTAMFTSALMFRREAIVDIDGFDESFRRHQDYELMAKFFIKKYQVGCLPLPLTKYSSMGGNNVRGKALEQLKEKFLNQFDNVITSLEENEKGARKYIVGCNYAYVFLSHLANKDFFLAMRLFIKYGITTTSGFFSYLFYYTKIYFS